MVLRSIIKPMFSGGEEDCLFLDVFVPGSAVRDPSTSKLPVVHWIFGGGYIFAPKDMLEGATLPFYDGSGMIKQSGDNIIYVASNYRLAAFRFMAGTTMEKDGLPSAGLWDQRAALQWTQDNIHLLGGDPTQVTVMGESAGARFILHHLTAGRGTVKPLFKRAIIQSAAFQPMWYRKGLEDIYKSFEDFGRCKGQRVACLRKTDSAALIKANSALNDASLAGAITLGPAADGSFCRQLPALELASGNFNKKVDALLISHTSQEATLFVDGHIATDAQFTEFIDQIFPAVCSLRYLTLPHY
jgi:carboxylesterase type B